MVELSWCFRAFRRERTTRFILIAIWLGERDLVRSSGSYVGYRRAEKVG